MNVETFPISVVVPTYNRLPTLKKVIHAIENQTVPKECFELIVVSDGSTDGTNDYLQSLQTLCRFKPVIQENQGAAAARNTGIRTASGEFVLFIDDDVVPANKLVQEHMSLHREYGDTVVVLGPMLTPEDYQLKPWVAWEQEMLYRQYESMESGRWQPTARQFYTGNTSLARKHLNNAGGFDPRFRRAEDVELAYRLANYDLQFVFAPQAVGYHYANRSFQSWLSTPYAYGRNDVIFTTKKGQEWLLPAVFREFYTRHKLTRQFVLMFLDRPRLSDLMVKALSSLAHVAAGANFSQFSRLAYSSIFNLRYYQGVADEYGGRSKFVAGLQSVPAGD